MKLAIIGIGQLGSQLFRAAQGPERLVIDQMPKALEKVADVAELGTSTQLSAAASCQVVAAALPAPFCPDAFQQLCPHLQPGTIVINFATGWLIPDELRKEFPQLKLVEAKLVGSAVGISEGLKSLFVLGIQDEELCKTIQSCFPPFRFIMGDTSIVKHINTCATATALRAAVQLQRELAEFPQEMINAATAGLMPGVLISYERNTLGEFARNILEQVQKES